MTLTSWFDILYVTIISVFAAGVILAGSEYIFGRKKSVARTLLREAETSVVFLFDDQDLVDATPAARILMRRKSTNRQSDWEVFLSVFAGHFPHLRETMSGLATAGRLRINAHDHGTAILDAEYWDGLVRISFIEQGEGHEAVVDRVAIVALEDEVATLRSLAEDAPQLIWKVDPTGTITWANRTYLELSERLNPTSADISPTWPPVNIFPAHVSPNEGEEPTVTRLPIEVAKSADPFWYEVTSLRRGCETMNYAIDVSAVVRAEMTQRNFVQTIAKTFAQLSIGLAIFDRQRRLMIFNPALTEMTGLPVDFLSSRPLIHMMLDRLREARMLPEPKNYSSWREQVTELETAAQNGSYCETWDLPNGQTYRVTGRPHPDGAVAFLFEDISAEVSLTRRFRSQLETGQAVLDSVVEAIAVFSPVGTLTLTNAAYDRLWQIPETEGLSVSSSNREAATWQSRSAPSNIWGDVQSYLRGEGSRDEWSETILLDDGRHLACRFAPMPGGSTLAGFSIIADRAPSIVRTAPQPGLRKTAG